MLQFLSTPVMKEEQIKQILPYILSHISDLRLLEGSCQGLYHQQRFGWQSSPSYWGLIFVHVELAA